MKFPDEIFTGVTPPGIVMYPWVFEKNPEEDDQGKTWFGLMLRFEKSLVDAGGEFADEWRDMRREFMRCAKSAWPEGLPDELASPIRDGDKFDKANNKKKKEELFGHYYINFKTQNQPEVVKLPSLSVITSKSDFYPGCVARASFTAFPYDNKGNEGIGVRLTNVAKVADGERIGGKPAAKEQFAKFGKGAPSQNDSDDLL